MSPRLRVFGFYETVEIIVRVVNASALRYWYSAKTWGGWGRCEGVQVLHCQMETVVSKLSMIPNLLIMRLAYG